MKRSEYIEKVLQAYSLVRLLSRKNGCDVLHLRNKKLGADLVLRSFPHSVAAYEKLQNIRHVNLPEVYDVLEMDDGQIVLEEHIDGLTVAQIMEAYKYRASTARKVLLGLCDALTALHDRGIIHRDVKPENVIVEGSGRTVLIDFNASRIESGACKDTVTIEVKNGSASISEDGRIARLTCDYSQTMTMGDSTVKATGVTEWTFSDYMTTVVEPNDSAAE